MDLKLLIKNYHGLGIKLLFTDKQCNEKKRYAQLLSTNVSVDAVNPTFINEYYDIIFIKNFSDIKNITDSSIDPIYYIRESKDNVSFNIENNIISVSQDFLSKNTIICDLLKNNKLSYTNKDAIISFFCIIVAIILEAYPLNHKKMIQEYFFNDKTLNQSFPNIKQSTSIKKSVIFPISHHYTINLVKKHIQNDNIVGFFNYQKKSFCDLNNTQLSKQDFNRIIVVNDLFTKSEDINFLQNFNKEIICVEKLFKTVSFEDGKQPFERKIIDTPLILIGSLTPESSKFECQLLLHKKLCELGYRVISETSNPWGFFFDFEVQRYSEKILFPDDVYKINRRTARYCVDKDICIKNIPGSLFDLNNIHSNSFGANLYAHLKALPVDIFILCINPFINLELIQYTISFLKLLGISHIMVVVSDRIIEPSTFERKSDFNYYHPDKKKYFQYYNYVKDYFSDYHVFSLNDIRNVFLETAIIEDLT